MRLETVFRVSVYATIALATLCLAITAESYLPGMNYFLVLFQVLLVLSFMTEGRWALTLAASNVLGLLIAAGSGIWIAVSLLAPSNPWIDNAPYPVAVLPLGGPVLMLVLLAKLFRPKQSADYWWLHLIALMEVALGCILAFDLEFGLWLFAYLACALWSLMLFASYRDRQRSFVAARVIGPGDLQRPDSSGHDERPSLPLPWRGWGLGLTFRRTFLVIGLGLVLFLLTPRFGNRPWNIMNPALPRAQMETGYSPAIDLNNAGEVKVSEEEAFRVSVEEADGKPKPDLNPLQRWRGIALDAYDMGRWDLGRWRGGRRRGFGIPAPLFAMPQIAEGTRADLPWLGPEAFYISFQVETWRSGGLFLAEPLAPPEAGNFPLRSLEKGMNWAPYFRERDSCLDMPRMLFPQEFHYLQVVPAWQVPVAIPPGLITPEYLLRLLRQPVAGITRWTEELLPQLVAQHQLTDDDLIRAPDPVLGEDLYLLPSNRAKVARALSDYFAFSGEFTYKLELQRSDRKLDVTEDFLRNIKQGFCEHYATALTLVLRSVGIPSRLVNGYRGAEPAGETPDLQGVYLVRQSHAHSWVEALMTRPGPDGQPELYWLTLDPTPAQDVRAKTALSWARWWRDGRQRLRDFWKNLILDYNVDRQQDTLWALGDLVGVNQTWALLESLGTWLQREVWSGHLLARRWPWLAVPSFFGFGLWAFRRRRSPTSQVASPSADVAFYHQWLDVLARYGRLERSPWQTPWEFAEMVQQALARWPGSAAVAKVSRQVISLYYRARFGARPLTPEESAAIERQVAGLESTLKGQKLTP
jgi:hypothetical protein